MRRSRPADDTGSVNERPRAVLPVAMVLVAAGFGAAFTGGLWASIADCCGTTEPGELEPLVLGLLVGGATMVAGVLLVGGTTSARTVALLAAAVPVASIAATLWSPGWALLAVPATAAWLVLVHWLRGPEITTWLTSAAGPALPSRRRVGRDRIR